MALATNPRKLANDIAQGFQQITPLSLRQYDLNDLNIILYHLNLVLRDLRSKPAAPADMEATRDRNLKMSRLNQAISVIQTHRATRGKKG